MFDYTGLGLFLRIIRKERHLTIAKASELANLSTTTVGNLELGKTRPKVETTLSLCDIYGISGGEIAYFYERNADTDHTVKILHYAST